MLVLNFEIFDLALIFIVTSFQSWPYVKPCLFAVLFACLLGCLPNCVTACLPTCLPVRSVCCLCVHVSQRERGSILFEIHHCSHYLMGTDCTYALARSKSVHVRVKMCAHSFMRFGHMQHENISGLVSVVAVRGYKKNSADILSRGGRNLLLSSSWLIICMVRQYEVPKNRTEQNRTEYTAWAQVMRGQLQDIVNDDPIISFMIISIKSLYFNVWLNNITPQCLFLQQ